jgi:leucyl aminopeptidase
VAGLFHTLSLLRPKGIRVLGTMCLVRNNIGEESYVADEIIVSRAGKRIRIVNTDAEGRLAMLDSLCEAKEQSLNERNPQLFTIATLTGF